MNDKKEPTRDPVYSLVRETWSYLSNLGRIPMRWDMFSTSLLEIFHALQEQAHRKRPSGTLMYSHLYVGWTATPSPFKAYDCMRLCSHWKIFWQAVPMKSYKYDKYVILVSISVFTQPNDELFKHNIFLLENTTLLPYWYEMTLPWLDWGLQKDRSLS